MNLHPLHIENEINDLISNCCKKPFKKIDSILGLKDIYIQLLQVRTKIIEQYPDFPGDPALESIINLLSFSLQDRMPLKKAEWTYDHYIDLFKFKAEELLGQVAEKLKQRGVVLKVEQSI